MDERDGLIKKTPTRKQMKREAKNEIRTRNLRIKIQVMNFKRKIAEIFNNPNTTDKHEGKYIHQFGVNKERYYKRPASLLDSAAK